MEPRRNSSSPAGKKVVEDENKLSLLPDDVVDRILHKLPLKDVAKLCLTSKKWRKLCLSIPRMIVDESKSFPKGSPQRLQFLDFLVDFMRDRRNAKSTELTIYWFNSKLTGSETLRITRLLNHAARCELKDLDVHLYLESEVYLFPHDIFSCESLKTLRIDLKFSKLELPTVCGFSYIKLLELMRVKIDNDDFGEWISSCCKCLEELELDRVSVMKKFKISIPSLLHLTIDHCYLENLDISTTLLQTITLCEPFGTPSSSLLHISAPKVLTLQGSGAFIRYLCVKISESKHFVELSLPRSGPKGSPDELKSLLSNIVQATELVIDAYSVQGMYEKNCMSFAFNNLQSLVVLYDELIFETAPALACFLQGLPRSVKKLCINHGYNWQVRVPRDSYETSGYNLKFWESQNFVFLNGLEEVKIDFRGGINEEGLIEYLLENAKKLKKVTISSKNRMPDKLEQKLIEKGEDCYSKGDRMIIVFRSDLNVSGEIYRITDQEKRGDKMPNYIPYDVFDRRMEFYLLGY